MKTMKDRVKIGKKISKTQRARLKAQRIIKLRVRNYILKELREIPNLDFIRDEDIKLNFYDIPSIFKGDYRELIEQFKENEKN